MIQQKGGEVTAAASVLSALAPDVSQAPGSTTRSLIGEISGSNAGRR
jgi:hypothetical protein